MFKSFFKKHVENFQRFSGTYEIVKVQTILQENEYRRVRDEIKNISPANVALFGKKVYSQTDEDGIIQEIFRRIPHTGTFMEIGIQTGIECNTLQLLLQGWRGVWVEGDAKYCQVIASELQSSGGNKLKVINSFIDRENIIEVGKSAHDFLKANEIDFFSLDIDGNDYYIMETLLNDRFFPKVVCVEYNAKFEPPAAMKIKYNKSHVWDTSDYMGCSIQSYVDLFANFNYKLVCCNIPGINAFFVRQEFAHLFENYPVDVLYQPYRYYLSPIRLAQTPTLRYLRDMLAETNNT